MEMKKRVNVALNYHFFAHYRRTIVERLARDTRHAWTFIGDTKDFESTLKASELSDAVHFERVKCIGLGRGAMWQTGLISRALSSRFRVVVYLANAKWLATWVAACVARLTGKRVVMWGHGWKRIPCGVPGLLRRSFYRIAHDLMVYGHWAKAIAISEGFHPDRVHVIYNSLDADTHRLIRQGITAERASQVRNELFSDVKTPVIVCSTRLLKARRFDLLFQAVKLLADEGVRCNILLIGDGEDRTHLEHLASDLGLKVVFTGSCFDETRIGELLMASTVCVSPGNIGLAAIHSLAFGIPVISHDNPEHQGPEAEAILPGRTGDVFREGDFRSLAATIKPWVRSSWVDSTIRLACIDEIDAHWNPDSQHRAISRVIDGFAADDGHAQWRLTSLMPNRLQGVQS